MISREAGHGWGSRWNRPLGIPDRLDQDALVVGARAVGCAIEFGNDT
jgi:hypothetical protein